LPKFVYDLVEKAALQATMQGGYVAKEEIATMLGTASLELFNHFLGRSDERKPGPHLGLNTRSQQALAPFVRRQQYSENPTGDQLPMTTGQFTLPADCAYVEYYDLPGADTVRQVSGFALRIARADVVNGPTKLNPLVTTVENGDIQIYPAETDHGTVQYIALPPAPVYAEKLDADNNLVYDDTASVDVGWGREHEPDLLERTLRLLAQATRDSQLAGTAGALTQENS
jgi:hypothetical protein